MFFPRELGSFIYIYILIYIHVNSGRAEKPWQFLQDGKIVTLLDNPGPTQVHGIAEISPSKQISQYVLQQGEFPGLLSAGRFPKPPTGLCPGRSRATAYLLIGPKVVVPLKAGDAHDLSEGIQKNSKPFRAAPPLCLLTLAVL